MSAVDSSNVTPFPFPVYTPGDSGRRGESPPPMLTLSGAPAVSEFRLAKLLAAIGDRVDHVTRIDSRYVHFADLDRELSGAERKVLESLLHYGPADHGRAPEGQLLLVVPRFGTVSPWSSKATDIAHVCGLEAVRRLERGIAYYLASPREFTDAERASIATVLHDRMTETVLQDAEEATALFRHTAPKPLTTVPLRRDGPPPSSRRTRRSAWRSPTTRSTTSSTRSAARARSDRRRADDVRAGELRALPPQDLQRRLDRRRRAPAKSRCSA